MFEDFRKQTEDAAFPDEEPEAQLPIEAPFNEDQHFLGMTPVQRFVVALMLLLMIVIVGLLFLLVTSKIVPPFLG
jgi:hypothetical protein